GREIELEGRDGATDRGRVSFDFDEVADRRLTECHGALGEAPFPPALLVAERPLETEVFEDRAKLRRVGDARLALLPRLDPLLEASRPFEGEYRSPRLA